MSLHALEIPDEPTALARWLERHLVGLNLGELVAELAAVNPATGPQPDLEQLLEGGLPKVLAEGLTAVPARLLTEMLRRPMLLLQLQQHVLEHGGRYWDKVDGSPGEFDQLLEQGRRQLGMLLAGEAANRFVTLKVAWYRRPWVVALATAASVLLLAAGYGWYERRQTTIVAGSWGWNGPGGLPADATPDVYLASLADRAAEWFDVRPANSLHLAQRISELRRGCTRLILAEHRPLPAADRDWLVGKCRDWAGKLDSHLAALEAGHEPSSVRDETDQTVQRLIAALRSRAEEIRARQG